MGHIDDICFCLVYNMLKRSFSYYVVIPYNHVKNNFYRLRSVMLTIIMYGQHSFGRSQQIYEEGYGNYERKGVKSDPHKNSTITQRKRRQEKGQKNDLYNMRCVGRAYASV